MYIQKHNLYSIKYNKITSIIEELEGIFMHIERIFDILSEYNNEDNLINKVRMSPDGLRIVVDVNFNRAITIREVSNEIRIEGDPVYVEKIKSIIEEAL